MHFTYDKENDTLHMTLHGRLDTTTSPLLENYFKENLEGITELSLDFEHLDYISSAGLRVILGAQKVMSKQGSMVIRNVSAEIMEVFEITGFSSILTIE